VKSSRIGHYTGVLTFFATNYQRSFVICYEHPLNERIRVLLRLEELFNRIIFFLSKNTAAEHHATMLALFEILDVTSRGDLKSDLLQELERQKQKLEVLRSNPTISEATLDQVLKDILAAFHSMLNISGKVGGQLRSNEWLMNIKQRAGVPGGVCEFDLPSYHYWLHLNPDLRRCDFDAWLAPLIPIRDSVSIVLYLLRGSGKIFKQVAKQGVFKQSGADRTAHMLRLNISEDFPCIPEISANKYALNIRFVLSDLGNKIKVHNSDVAFDLIFCSL